MKKPLRNRIISLVISITVIMVLCLSACSKSESKPEKKSLYAQGLEIVQLMVEMTQTEEYVDIYTGDSKIKTVIQNIGSGNYSAPKAVYSISFTEENLAEMAELNNLGEASEGLKDFMLQRVLGTLMTQINGMSGVENLAASSVCTVGKTFVNENADGNVVYLYTYEAATPVAVTFTVGEDKAISATGVFVMYDEFTCGSVDEIKAFFHPVPVEVEEVQVEK